MERVINYQSTHDIQVGNSYVFKFNSNDKSRYILLFLFYLHNKTRLPNFTIYTIFLQYL